MWRLIGAALLVGSGAWMGLAAAGELSRRVRALESWSDALGLLESELAFRSPDLPELLETVAGRAGPPAREALVSAGNDLKKLDELPFAQIWRDALTVHDGGLAGEDVDTLSRLGDVLGRYGWEDQRRMLEAIREDLNGRAARAREERERKGRAYGAFGLAVGAFVTILLL